MLQILRKFKQMKCILVQLEDKRQSLSLKSHEKQQQECVSFFPSSSSVLVLGRQTSAFFHPHKKKSHEVRSEIRGENSVRPRRPITRKE